MKPDLYTKVALTVIALLLLLIACNQYVNPEAKVRAEGPFAGVQYASNLEWYDSRTGEIWSYKQAAGPSPYGQPYTLYRKDRLVKLGQPLVKEFYGK